MGKLAMIALVAGGISLVVAIISRLLVINVAIAPGGIRPESFLTLTIICLLAAIAISLAEKK